MRTQHLEQKTQTNKIISELQNKLESANEKINLLENAPQKFIQFLEVTTLLTKSFVGLTKLTFWIDVPKDAKFIIADVFLSCTANDHFVIYFQQNCKESLKSLFIL